MVCLKHFYEKEPSLGLVIINGLLKFWPITNPAKEVIYINEIEEVLDANPSLLNNKHSDFAINFVVRLSKCVQSMHYQVAEKSLTVLVNSDAIIKLVEKNKQQAYPKIVAALMKVSK